MYGYMSKPKTSRQIKIPDEALRDLLTSSEIRMLQNRYQIRNFLKEGLTVRSVAEKVGVGTDTVVRVAKMLQNTPPRVVSRGSTPWIFGKAQ